MKRRTLLKTIGIGIATAGVLPSTASANQNNLQKYIRDNGHYVVNNRGTRNPIPHGFQSKRPLRKETNRGGVVQVHPKGNGIFLKFEPGADNDWAGPGFNSEKLLLDDISKITGESIDNQVSVNLWVEDPRDNHNDVIFEWEDQPGKVQRRVSLDGDHVAFGPTVGPGKFEVARDAVFKDRNTGVKRDIDKWQEVLGDEADARVLLGMAGNEPFEATITEFDIQTQ